MMKTDRPTLQQDALYVVETADDKVFLGSVHLRYNTVTVKTHRVGRPPVLHLRDVVQITAAEQHPDVVLSYARS